MSVQHQLFMYCDGPPDEGGDYTCPNEGMECFSGDYSDATSGTKEQYRRAAAREGWKFIGGRDLCPECVAAKARGWKP